MNKKLVEKLQSKLQRVKKKKKKKKLQSEHKTISAYSLGALAFTTIGGSYGKTMNPFRPDGHNMVGGKIIVIRSPQHEQHAEFRRGFNSTRKPKPLKDM